MRFRPGCCCCMDVHARVGRVELIRLENDKGRLIHSTTVNGDMVYVDYKNKRVWMSPGGADVGLFIRHFDAKTYEDLQTPITFSPSSGPYRIGRGIAVDPEHEYVFFSAIPIPGVSPTQGHLRRYKYDGTGGTSIITRTESSPGITAPGWLSLCVSREPKYLFGLQFAETGTFGLKVIRCGIDGSGDTTIWSEGPTTHTFNVGIWPDNENRKIWFSEATLSATNTGSARIRRCDFDGGNLETIYEEQPRQLWRLAGWSHIQQRLYFWWPKPATAQRGFFSVDVQGNVRKEVMPVDNKWGRLPSGGDPIALALGCGFNEYPLAT